MPPARVVASPSATSASPAKSSRSRLVISLTALTCPTFSAIKTTRTGRATAMAEKLNSGAWKSGNPTQAASAIVSAAPSLKLPVSAAKTQPMMTPMRMPSREIIPRPAIVHNTIASKVTAATIGWVWKFDAAVGAKFKPIKATMAPVTAGGMTASTTLRPAIFTMKPMSIKVTPVTKMEPACAPMPYCSEAARGAIKAKEDPR